MTELWLGRTFGQLRHSNNLYIKVNWEIATTINFGKDVSHSGPRHLGGGPWGRLWQGSLPTALSSTLREPVIRKIRDYLGVFPMRGRGVSQNPKTFVIWQSNFNTKVPDFQYWSQVLLVNPTLSDSLVIHYNVAASQQREPGCVAVLLIHRSRWQQWRYQMPKEMLVSSWNIEMWNATKLILTPCRVSWFTWFRSHETPTVGKVTYCWPRFCGTAKTKIPIVWFYFPIAYWVA